MATSAVHRVLHIGGTPLDARVFRDALGTSPLAPCDLEWLGTLTGGLERLAVESVSAVLLDWRQPDGVTADVLRQLIVTASPAPVLVIADTATEHLARQAVEAGAFDYVLSNDLDNPRLFRLLSHAFNANVSANALAAEQERVEITLNSIGDAVIWTDLAGTICYHNQLAESMTGWPRAEANGRLLDEVLQVIDDDTRERIHCLRDRLPLALQVPQTPVSNCLVVRRNGSETPIEYSATPIRNRSGAAIGLLIVLRDVSAARALSLRMSHLASHDALTDLPNRLLLNDRLARALARASRHGRRLAVLFVDIDHFKDVNDAFGHIVGDELLQAVGRAITMCVRSSDTVSRHGGDEFVVVLSELEHVEDAAKGAEKVIAALVQPHRFAGQDLHITVSIGISVFPNDGEDAGALLVKADMALYHAKELGRNGYQFFEPGLNLRATERQLMEVGLRRAISKQEFELRYQPQVNLTSGEVVGVEALIYWQHPDRGLIGSAEFLTVAEDRGLIKSIGRWAIVEACRQARAWQVEGVALPVAVNISAVEFRSPDFLENIGNSLKDAELESCYLKVEVTERTLMADVGATRRILATLGLLGVHLVLDDFGTGWSNLSLVKDLPIDSVKIHSSFLCDVAAGSDALRLTAAVIHLTRTLSSRVICAGVESGEQVALLQAEGCHEGQGRYFSEPMTGQALLRRSTREMNYLLASVRRTG